MEQRRSQATTNTSTGTSDFHNESCFIVNDLDLDFKITSEGPHKPKLPPLKKLRKIEEQKKVESHPISCPICLSDVNEIASRKDKVTFISCGVTIKVHFYLDDGNAMRSPFLYSMSQASTQSICPMSEMSSANQFQQMSYSTRFINTYKFIMYFPKFSVINSLLKIFEVLFIV